MQRGHALHENCPHWRYVYLDESGSIHKNSKTRYFAVGGYFSLEQDKLKIKAKYKKEN